MTVMVIITDNDRRTSFEEHWHLHHDGPWVRNLEPACGPASSPARKVPPLSAAQASLYPGVAAGRSRAAMTVPPATAPACGEGVPDASRPKGRPGPPPSQVKISCLESVPIL